MNRPPPILDAASAARLIAAPPLGPEIATLAVALALGATGRFDELGHVLEQGRAAGVPRERLVEGLLMVHLFGGFPRAIESFRALDRAFGEPPLRALSAPDPAATRSPSESERRRAGNELFKRIYGDKSRAVLEQLARAHPSLAEAVLVDAYGRVLSRPALDARTRELMAVTALAVQELPRQLESHLRGALACGANPAETRAAVEVAGVIAGDAALEAAIELLRRVMKTGA